MEIKGAAYIVDIKPGEAIPKESGGVGSATPAKASARGAGVDRVELSSKGLELAKLRRDLDALPDVRLDRVALAKQHVQDGGYRLAPGVLAQKMMETFGSSKGEVI